MRIIARRVDLDNAVALGGALGRISAATTDCAQLCTVMAEYAARDSQFVRSVATLCEKVCDRCAKECSRFDVPHLRECAEACRRCAAECRALVRRAPTRHAEHDAVPA